MVESRVSTPSYILKSRCPSHGAYFGGTSQEFFLSFSADDLHYFPEPKLSLKLSQAPTSNAILTFGDRFVIFSIKALWNLPCVKMASNSILYNKSNDQHHRIHPPSPRYRQVGDPSPARTHYLPSCQ